MKVILCPNPFRDKGLKGARAAAGVLTAAGAETVFCFPFSAEKFSASSDFDPTLPMGELRAELPGADCLVCFGGDGTFLHVAKDASSFGVPIVGVNMGNVGFMTELELNELSHLARLVSGDYTLETRMLLDVRVLREGRMLYRSAALNDAVITKGAVARVIDLRLFSDKAPITNIAGDGVIVATPTGSTAYSLSSGGPIVEPSMESILITPVNAHALQSMPLVLNKNHVIDVVVSKQSRKTAYLSVDGGKAFKLFAGDTVQVSRSRRSLSLIKLTGKSFYDIINQKLERRVRS